jgi:coenzyme F420-reducing hydrogenase beta subunit
VNQEFQGNQPLSAWAGWHEDSGIVLNSSSGGVFYGIAQAVLAEGGVVFAAVYTDDCKRVEFASTDETPLHRMLKSKYVESAVGLSFRRVRKALEQGRRVLFCGTPCQTAGLHRYLGKEYEGLLTCDFACGGLPAHGLYQEHLSNLEKKYRAAVQSVDFRPKTYGWKRYALRVGFRNGKEYIRLGTEDPYLRGFLYGKYTVRDYCLDCKFSQCHASDLTIADFWLHEKLSSLKHDEGISLILCNTPKGKTAVDALRESFVLEELDVQAASYNNRPQTSEQKKARHDAFVGHCLEEGFGSACEKFLPLSTGTKIKSWIVRTCCRRKGTP